MPPVLSTSEWIILMILLVPTMYAMMKGAPFVPTPMVQVRRMLKEAQLKPGMTIYDLGSGDGRLVHTAEREYQARAIGYELSPLVWLWARFLALFWRSKAELRFGNFWNKDISDADVIVCYLLPHSMQDVRKKLLNQLKPGTLIISHSFKMEGITPLKAIPFDREKKLGSIWIYKIEGAQKSPKKAQTKKRSKKTAR